jgi:hypothetical protein
MGEAMTVLQLAVRTLAVAAALAIIGLTPAGAKQPCSTTAGKGFWSWRMIDDRKCWYEGKPGLSKALLEWPAQAAAPASPAPARADPQAEQASDAPAMRHDPPALRRDPAPRGDPMDARAQVRDDDAGTFNALWRSRIENR